MTENVVKAHPLKRVKDEIPLDSMIRFVKVNLRENNLLLNLFCPF
jgi:hypothetical protein